MPNTLWIISASSSCTLCFSFYIIPILWFLKVPLDNVPIFITISYFIFIPIQFIALFGFVTIATAIELQGYHHPQPVYAQPAQPLYAHGPTYVKAAPVHHVKAVHSAPVYKQV